ncbi:MAG: serine hydrolase domain-containing protein, partial [Pseudomonadota bacterium]
MKPFGPSSTLFALIPAMIGCSSTAALADADRGLKTCLAEVIEQSNFHGVAAIGDKNEIRATFAIDRENGETGTFTIETRFNVGSMYKMITAVAIGQLVDAGLFEFSDTLGDHMSDIPDSFKSITVEQLLTHTAGTGNYRTPSNMQAVASHKSVDDLLPLVFEQDPQEADGFAYSNSGFIVLAALIEAITDERYEIYTQTNILDEAGMKHTGLMRDQETAKNYTRLSPGASPGQTQPSPDAHLRESAFSPPRGMPAGGGYSTAGDLYRFARALENNVLLSAETHKVMTDSKILIRDGRGGPVHYGYGFILRENGELYGHGGGAPGINGELLIHTDDDWIVSTLTNIDPPTASRT